MWPGRRTGAPRPPAVLAPGTYVLLVAAELSADHMLLVRAWRRVGAVELLVLAGRVAPLAGDLTAQLAHPDGVARLVANPDDVTLTRLRAGARRELTVDGVDLEDGALLRDWLGAA